MPWILISTAFDHTRSNQRLQLDLDLPGQMNRASPHHEPASEGNLITRPGEGAARSTAAREIDANVHIHA
jgi:hypothetical protein